MIKQEKEWDLVIKPAGKLYDIGFKDVWHYRDLLLLLVRRDFVSFYKQTVLGPLWFFVQPVITILVYNLIFGNLAGIKTDGIPGPLFYLAGTIIWNYFSDCLTKTATVFKDNAGMLGKVYFPRLIMPLSIVFSNLIRFAVQLTLFIGMWLYYLLTGHQVLPNAYILLFPFLILMIAALGLGFGMIVSAVTTKYRDLSFVVSFGVPLLMYTTTVVYPLSEVLKKYSNYSWLIKYNPLTAIIESCRYGFLGAGSFNWQLLSYSVILTIIVLFTGVIIFNKVEKTFVDTI